MAQLKEAEMAKEIKQDIVVGLDLGTTKVCTIIGEQDEEGQVHIIGVGTTPPRACGRVRW